MTLTLDERIKLEIEKPLSMKKLEAKMRYIYRYQWNLYWNLYNKEKASEIQQEPNKFLQRKKPFHCI